jgi:hypothetical protein
MKLQKGHQRRTLKGQIQSRAQMEPLLQYREIPNKTPVEHTVKINPASFITEIPSRTYSFYLVLRFYAVVPLHGLLEEQP